MSRPVVARLAPFNRTSGPSTFDEAIVGSVPAAVLKSTATVSASGTVTAVRVPWATVSSTTTLSLGYDTGAGGFGSTITNYDRTLYNPLATIAPGSLGTASQIVVSADGVYRFSGQVLCSLSGAMVVGDSLALDAYVNGTQIRRLDLITVETAGTIASASALLMRYDFVRPLTAGTYVELAIAGAVAAGAAINVAAAAPTAGAECYVERETTLVHVVPQ